MTPSPPITTKPTAAVMPRGVAWVPGEGRLDWVDKFWRSSWPTAALVLVDALAFSLLWLVAYELRQSKNLWFPQPINDPDYYFRAQFLMVPLWMGVAAMHGLYAHRERLSSLAQTRHLLGVLKDGLIGGFALAYLLKGFDLGRSVILIASIFNFLWLFASRTAFRELKRRALESGFGLRRAVIVGTGELARRVVSRVTRHAEVGYHLVGLVSTQSGDMEPSNPGTTAWRLEFDQLPTLGGVDRLPKIVKDHGIDEVFVASPDLANNAMLNVVARCEGTGARFNLCANILEVITDRVKVDDFGDLPLIPFRGTVPTPAFAFAKRLLDLSVCLALLAVFAVPMGIIAAAIFVTSGAPVIFRQTRIGRGGKPFMIYKFRTMVQSTPIFQQAPTEANDPRITAIGRLLRKTSLDELPQLFNVLRGEMSMVGPRPEMPFIVEGYQEWQQRRLDVKPGITGLWQIIGRKNLPLSLNLEYDFFYIKNQSLMLDVVILLRTIPAVIFGRGAY